MATAQQHVTFIESHRLRRVDDLMRQGGPRLVNQWLEEMRIFRRPPEPISPSGYWRWDGTHLAWMPKGRTMAKLWVMNG